MQISPGFIDKPSAFVSLNSFNSLANIIEFQVQPMIPSPWIRSDIFIMTSSVISFGNIWGWTPMNVEFGHEIQHLYTLKISIHISGKPHPHFQASMSSNLLIIPFLPPPFPDFLRYQVLYVIVESGILFMRFSYKFSLYLKHLLKNSSHIFILTLIFSHTVSIPYDVALQFNEHLFIYD